MSPFDGVQIAVHGHLEGTEPIPQMLHESILDHFSFLRGVIVPYGVKPYLWLGIATYRGEPPSSEAIELPANRKVRHAFPPHEVGVWLGYGCGHLARLLGNLPVDSITRQGGQISRILQEKISSAAPSILAVDRTLQIEGDREEQLRVFAHHLRERHALLEVIKYLF